jgi:hypothetical protein
MMQTTPNQKWSKQEVDSQQMSKQPQARDDDDSYSLSPNGVHPPSWV